MIKKRIARSAVSFILTLALTVNGFLPGTPSAGTVHATEETVTITGTNDGDDARTGTGKMTIHLKIKESITPTVSITGWMYGEEAHAPELTGNTGTAPVTYSYKLKDAEDGTYTETVPTEPGDYTLRAEIAETAEYKGATVTADFTIAPFSTTMTITLVITPQEAVINWINNLPAKNDVTIEHKDAIEAARKAYDELTNEQKNEVPEALRQKLSDVEEALEAAKVSDMIDKLPAGSDVTTANKDAIKAARAAYNALTKAQKAYVSETMLAKLVADEDALAAAAVSDKINALPASTAATLADGEDVEAARTAYEALTNTQKDYVLAATLEKLRAVESAIAVAVVNDKIQKLPAFGEVATTDGEDIEAAKTAYDALTAEQKQGITPEVLQKLTDALAALQIARAADTVTAKTGTDVVYTGNPLSLVNAPTLDLPAGYTLQYAIGTTKTPAPTSGFQAGIPTATDAGTYYVFMKAVGTRESAESRVFGPVEVVLAKAEQEAPKSEAFYVFRASNSITKDGSIYGVNDTMEYSVDGGQTWVKVPKEATDITGLSTGSVQLRYAETANYNPSPALTVTVGYGSAELSVYFAPDSDSEYDQIVTYNEEQERYEYVYTGSRITPVIVVEGIDTRLTEGLDYTVTYKNNVNVDKKGNAAQVIVTGKGNYEKKRTVEFYILPKQLDDGTGEAAEDVNVAKVVVAEGGTAAPVISYNGTVLKKSEYTVTSSTGSLKFKTAVEGATLTITAKEGGNFTGAIKDIPVTVLAKADAKKAAIKVTLAKGVSRTYNGEPQYLVIAEPEGQGDAAESDNAVAPELTVTDASGKVLEEGTDFVVSYSANVNAGTVKVTVTGIGDYTGTVTKSFKINPDKKDAEIRTYFAGETGDEMIPTDEKEAAPKFEFQKNGVKPAIIVTAVRGDEEITLSEGTDYKVSYSGNKKVGTNAKFTVTFLGNYKGRAAIKNQTFEIVKASLADAQITVPDVTYRTYDTWSGRKYANKSVPYVTIDGVELKQGTDYTVTYWVKDEKINPNAIKFAADEQYRWIDVKITGKGNYADETFESGYSVKRVAKNSTVFDLTKAKIYAKGTKKAVPKQGYLGEPIEPAIDVYVKVGSTWQLVDESLYEVHYINNIERGTAKIVVVGNGEEAVGNKKANFKIVRWQFSLLSRF